MTAISYHDTVNDLQGLGFTSRSPFARPEWFAMVAKPGVPAFVPVARYGEEALALPLERNGDCIAPLTNWYAFTWSALSTEGAIDRQALASLAWGLKSEGRRVTLTKLPDEDQTASTFESAFRDAGWFVRSEPCDTNHVLNVSGRSYHDYLAARPGSLRTTLKRRAKRVEVAIICEFQSDVWASYADIYDRSWKPEEGDPALLRAFAEHEGRAGRLRLGLAFHEGSVVAAQMWTVDHGVAYIHKLAHLESAKPLSAGTTLTAALFEHVIDRDKVELVDFGTGDDAYKRDWMDEIRLRYRLTCWNPRNPKNWPAIGKTLLRQLVSRAYAR